MDQVEKYLVVLGDGSVLNMRRTIIWSNGDQIHWLIHASPSLNKF